MRVQIDLSEIRFFWIFHFITDQLGSVVAMTDSTGTLLSQSRYLPFGQVRTDVGSITQTDFGYTGQRDIDEQNNSFSLSLLYYNARFYDASLQRFISPDSITAGEPQGLNRY
jgi:RHS repeat-associated protein